MDTFNFALKHRRIFHGISPTHDKVILFWYLYYFITSTINMIKYKLLQNVFSEKMLHCRMFWFPKNICLTAWYVKKRSFDGAVQVPAHSAAACVASCAADRSWPRGREDASVALFFDFEMVDLNHVQKMKAAFFLHIAADYGSHFGSSFFWGACRKKR